VIGVLHSSGSWTAVSVGLETRIAPLLAFALGLAAYPVFLFLTGFARLHRLSGEPDFRAWVNDMGRTFPRARGDRVVAWIAQQMNPFTEEFITRGVLVLMLSAQGVGLLPAALLGAVLCAAVHAYQGTHALPFQVAFFAASLGLLFSPAGLWACFGFHFAGDAVPWLTFRWLLRRARAGRAAKRTAAQAVTAASHRTSRSKSSTDA